MYHVWPVSSFFTKRYHKVLSGSLCSALTAHGRNEVCRRKALFLPSLKRLIEHLHSNVVSYRQKTTDRPSFRQFRTDRPFIQIYHLQELSFNLISGAFVPDNLALLA